MARRGAVVHFEDLEHASVRHVAVWALLGHIGYCIFAFWKPVFCSRYLQHQQRHGLSHPNFRMENLGHGFELLSVNMHLSVWNINFQIAPGRGKEPVTVMNLGLFCFHFGIKLPCNMLPNMLLLVATCQGFPWNFGPSKFPAMLAGLVSCVFSMLWQLWRNCNRWHWMYLVECQTPSGPVELRIRSFRCSWWHFEANPPLYGWHRWQHEAATHQFVESVPWCSSASPTNFQPSSWQFRCGSEAVELLLVS